MNNIHVTVLKQEVLEFCPANSRIVLDGTLGGGGHTLGLLGLGADVISSDLDSGAIELFQTSLTKEQLGHWKPIHASFDDALKQQPDESLDYIIADLGFSSNQLELVGRGFSYLQRDELLDLRYDAESGEPAWKKLYKMQPEPLAKILFEYSGEKLSRKIAEQIIEAKKLTEQLTVGEVADAIESVIFEKLKYKTNGILSRIWQALRIWTNDEFVHLAKFLELAPAKLKTGGRIAIISFHSLEDKLVTKNFRTLARPLVLDDYGNTAQRFALLTKEAVVPTQAELDNNPRSRSAMLRVLEKR
jgi:16S rRNA (cytosine1402-N4)-methyltransferase